MKIRLLFTLFINIAIVAFAQEGTDTLASFSDAEQEAEYQSFYTDDEEEEAAEGTPTEGSPVEGADGEVINPETENQVEETEETNTNE